MHAIDEEAEKTKAAPKVMRVSYKGVEVEVPKFGPMEFIAFERKYKVPASRFSEDGADVYFEWLCFLTYSALKRSKLFSPDASFDDVLPDLELDIEEDEEAPTDDEALDPTE